ncbi:MAG: CDP-alcohol phosphatidyltransferase family protein [Alphaproteobacteria bacterium]
MINIPNILSLARLLSVPVAIMLMLDGNYTACFWLFVAAGVTDAIDGWIAKTFDARTEFGAFLDPLADKALIVSTYLMLGWLGHIPGWLVVLVVFRDVLIIGGAMVAYLMLGDFRSRPLAISKLNTAVQIALVAAVLSRLGIAVGHPMIDWALVHVAAATTLASGFAYLWEWGRRLARADGQQ